MAICTIIKCNDNRLRHELPVANGIVAVTSPGIGICTNALCTVKSVLVVADCTFISSVHFQSDRYNHCTANVLRLKNPMQHVSGTGPAFLSAVRTIPRCRFSPWLNHYMGQDKEHDDAAT